MIITLSLYSILCFVLMFILTKFSYRLNLLDRPNKRKIHNQAIAYTGGIIISVLLIISLELFDIVYKELNIILSIGFLISCVGLIDDKFELNAGGKLSLQIIPIFYLIVFEKLTLLELGNYSYFNLELGNFTIPFTLVSVLLLINAFNYFDGIDGALGFTSVSVLLILYFLANNDNIKIYIITIILPICFFLLFNFAIFKLPKLFLGDSGSLLLGFLISFILIYFAKEKIAHPILLAWTISLFVYEFLAVNLHRIENKKNLFKAGQDHLHHLLLKKTNSILFTSFILSFTNLILYLIGFIAFKYISPLVSLLIFLISFFVYYKIRKIFL